MKSLVTAILLIASAFAQTTVTGAGASGTGTSAPQTQGTAATGVAPVGNPVYVAGFDIINSFVRPISVDQGGGVNVGRVAITGGDATSNTLSLPLSGGGVAMGSQSFDMVFNGTTWDRLRGNTSGVALLNNSAALADAASNSAITLQTTGGSPIVGAAYNMIFNGTNWDRLRGNTTGLAIQSVGNAMIDGISNSSNLLSTNGGSTLYTPGQLIVFNGTTWDRQRTASLANFPTASTTTARNSIGAQIAENGSRWSVNSAPAVSNQASASIAAEASVRHVLDKVCYSGGATTAPVATSIQVNIRDGATGAGTVIMSFELDIPASTGQLIPPFCTPSLNLTGTTNTAMTAEFSALLTNLKESISITGYNIN